MSDAGGIEGYFGTMDPKVIFKVSGLCLKDVTVEEQVSPVNTEPHLKEN